MKSATGNLNVAVPPVNGAAPKGFGVVPGSSPADPPPYEVAFYL
jgi:hypothetical protein